MLPNYVRFTFLALLPVAFGASAQSTAPASPAAAPAATASAAASPAAPMPPDTVLIRNELVTLTRGEYDLELTKLPADARGGFGADPTRVNALLNRMLIGKTMAAQARAAGIDKLPETQQRIASETDRLLATLYVETIDAQAAKEFDARPGLETAARERWLADPDKYRSPEQVDITHIVFELSKHGNDEALKLAQAARAKIVAGADMNTLARDISEDPAAKRNAGRIDGLTRDQVDPAFTQGAFALKKPGDISEPVLSRVGYHIIRLDAKRPPMLIPFEQVKPLIIADMRRQYVEQRRGERMSAIRNDPKIVVNEPAVEALVIRVDPEVFRKAMEAAKAAREKSQASTAPK